MIRQRMPLTTAALAVAAMLTLHCPTLAGEPAPAGQAEIRLPKPKTQGGTSLAETLAKRRTHRKISDEPLTREQVSQLCWAAQGITEPKRGLRTAPSAGALYPIAVFLIDRTGLYEYQPRQHALRRTIAGDIRKNAGSGSLRQSAVRSAPVCMVLAMDVARTAAKYHKDAERYCLLEAGHVAQNVLLQATALGLVSVPIGGLDEAKLAAVLKLPDRLRPVYLLPVGHPTRD